MEGWVKIYYFVKVKWSTYFLGSPIAYRCFVILSSGHFSIVYSNFTHIICSNIFYSLNHFLAFIILFVFLSFRYLSPPFPFPFHPFIDKRRDAKIFVHAVCVQSSIDQFSLSPPLRTLICFVYKCYIDPLPSAAAADSRSIQSVVTNCNTSLRTIYVCTMYMHCNRSLLPFSIILKSKHCVLYICNGIMPLLPLSY